MLVDIYNQLLISSAVAGALYLILKLSIKLTRKYFTASWHYYSYIVIATFFLIPYHKVASLFNLHFSSGIETNRIEGAPIVGLTQPLNVLAPGGLASQVVDEKSMGYVLASIAAEALPYVLLSGTVIFWGIVLVQNYKLKHLILDVCELACDPHVLEAVAYCKKKLNINKEVPVYIVPYMITPFLYGLFRPKIILPSIDFSREEYRQIFLHELTHYRRRDVWMKSLMVLINSIHWFNPFAYIARRDIDQFCELSCDEIIVKSMSTYERRRYCELLLHVLWNAADHKARLYSALSDKRKNLERRVTMILKDNDLKSKKWARMAAISLTLALAFVGSVAAYAASGNELDSSLETVVLSEAVKTKQVSDVNQSSISNVPQAQPRAAVSAGQLETVEDTSMDFNILAAFSISDDSLSPNYYVTSTSTYYIDPGEDSLQYSANWSPTGQAIQIGFVSATDSNVQYWSTNKTGGSTSGTLGTSNVAAGEYYVAIGTPSSNTEDVSVNGTFEWK